jgi:hypothetical protein
LVERRKEPDQQIAVINPTTYTVEEMITVKQGNTCKWITHSRGELYLSCPSEHKVLKVSLTGTIIAEFGVDPIPQGLVPVDPDFTVVALDPAEVAVDGSGLILLADSRNNRVQVYGAELECLGILEIPEMSLRPCGMFLDTRSRILYLTCHWSNSTLVLQLA